MATPDAGGGGIEVRDGGGHLDALDLPVRSERRDAVHRPRAGLDNHRPVRVRHEAAVEAVLHEAADAVHAHLAVGAVRVEDAHLPVGRRRWLHEDDPVRPDAEVAVADLDGQLAPLLVSYVKLRRLGDDEVVAGAVHLPERER